MYNIIQGINNIPQRDDKDVITSRILLFYVFGNGIYCGYIIRLNCIANNKFCWPTRMLINAINDGQ